jgi:hypothetical protein
MRQSPLYPDCNVSLPESTKKSFTSLSPDRFRRLPRRLDDGLRNGVVVVEEVGLAAVAVVLDEENFGENNQSENGLKINQK